MNIEMKPLTVHSVSKSPEVEFNHEEALVTVAENKLIFTKEAIKALNATAGDRITINYWTVNSKETFPVIGKSECFSDNTGGNRLTKSNTVSFRGSQREILKEYGVLYHLEPFKNYFKMIKEEIPLDNENLKEEEQDLENLK